MFNIYREAGYSVFPSNGVPMVKWKAYQTVLPTEAEAKEWDKKYTGETYELVCGAVSGVVALDIDTDDEAVIGLIESIIGKPIYAKRGSKGYTVFFKYGGESTTIWKDANGKVLVELLSDKHTTAIQGKHRVTRQNYKWLGDGLIGAKLKPLDARLVGVLDAMYPKPKFERTEYRHEYDNDSLELKQVADMLSYIVNDADGDRITWVQIGMALRAEFGDMANGLWHKWSATSDKYNVRDAEAAWRSFTGEGRTIGTVIARAIECGYRFPEPEVVEEAGKIEVAKEKPVIVHGLVGELADWITAGSWRPQPKLSLSAAITLMALLKGKRFKTATEVYANVYCMNVACSGSGKDYPYKVIRTILDAIGKPHMNMYVPASGAGFMDGLSEVGGHGLLCIDEMGMFMEAAKGNSAQWRQQTFKFWMETFTSSATYVAGERRANAAKEKTSRVDKPMFCLLGSSTREKLLSGMQSEDVSSGLLNRFMFFVSDESPKKRKNHERRKEVLPNHMIERLKGYVAEMDAKQDAKPVRFRRDAYDFYDRIDEHFEVELQKVEDERLRLLYGRAHEYVGKLALVLCDDREIIMRDVEVAFELVKISIRDALEFCGDLSSSNAEDELIKVKRFIKNHSPVIHKRLVNNTRFLDERRRYSIISDLVAGEVIIVVKEGKTVVYQYIKSERV